MGKAARKFRLPAPATPEHPWERLPDEPDSAWEAFASYRDMGPGVRSSGKLAEKYRKNRSLFEKWCQRWDWVARCHAYDSWVDRETKRAEISEVKEMRKRHIQMAMSLQGAAALALNKIIAAEKSVVKNADGTTSPAPLTLKPSEVKDIAELGLKIERLNRGEPGEIEDVRVELDKPVTVVHEYSKLSSEELRQLKSLVKKARSDGEQG